MHKNMLITLFVAQFVCSTLIAMDSSIVLEKATSDDLQQTLDLINNNAAHDAADRLVILPTQFRSQALQSSIEGGRIFIAKNNKSEVIGFKKLLILNKPAETREVLEDEIRCVGTVPAISGTLSEKSFTDTTANKEFLLNFNRTLFIYDGSDYTHPAYRRKSINKALTDYALESKLGKVQEMVTESQLDHIALVYGLVKANAGDVVGQHPDRTKSIAASFRQFIANLNPKLTPEMVHLEHARFDSFKPSFDPKSTELKPLPDQYSIPGYGCMLRYTLPKGL